MIDDRVEHFESALVVVEWGDQERVVTFARLPESMSGWHEILDGHSDDQYIYWYAGHNEWDQIINAQAGDQLPSEDTFIRLATTNDMAVANG